MFRDLLRGLGEAEEVFLRDDFASAFLFQIAAGAACDGSAFAGGVERIASFPLIVLTFISKNPVKLDSIENSPFCRGIS